MIRFRTSVPLTILVFWIFPTLLRGQQNNGVYDCATGQPEAVPASSHLPIHLQRRGGR